MSLSYNYYNINLVIVDECPEVHSLLVLPPGSSQLEGDINFEDLNRYILNNILNLF